MKAPWNILAHWVLGFLWGCTFIIFMYVFYVPPCNASDDWTPQNTHLEWAWVALHGADWLQTRYIATHPERFSETNPILGEHPSVGTVNLFFAATTGLHYLISRKLHPEQRKWFQLVSIGVSGGAVARNYHLGVRMEF